MQTSFEDASIVPQQTFELLHHVKSARFHVTSAFQDTTESRKAVADAVYFM